MLKESKSFLTLTRWDNFKGLRHFITTRNGGCSPEPYSSLNLGLGTEDNPANVINNRKTLASSLDIPLESFIMLNQVHGKEVAVVDASMKGKGAFDRESAIRETDAMITNQPDICLFIMAADCVPLLFFDPVKRVIGVAHAGWRGTVQKIGVKTVQKMNSEYDSKFADIHVIIGPSIGSCCYQVGHEVVKAVEDSFGSTQSYIYQRQPDTTNFDLWYANKAQLVEIGVDAQNIEIIGMCTQCHHDKFFSSRHGKGITGRFGAGILLNS
ncbi:MAG: peptidoglycan editing factor PgeF [Bacteroidota bacterium]|nr:peptidoglycan editing factor PgeF [Bacteroidota bacterium]